MGRHGTGGREIESEKGGDKEGATSGNHFLLSTLSRVHTIHFNDV